MRAAIVLAIVVAPAVAAADPEPHAIGAWVELGIDSSLASSLQAPAVDLPSQHLALGAQLAHTSIGVEGGLAHAPGGPTRVDVGPVLRQQLAARGATELIADAAVLASIGLSGSQDGGPTLYTFEGGVEARHWIDRHLAIGGGVLVHGTTVSQNMTTGLDLGVAGTLHVGGVF